jgi:tetratricopeptide (TPR) repeat protein
MTPSKTSSIRDVTRMSAILGRTVVVAVCLLACTPSATPGQVRSREVQAYAVEPVGAAGRTIAEGMARADARRKVIAEAAARLRALPAVRTLGLKEGEVDAFAAGLLDVEPRPSPAPSGSGRVRVDMAGALDLTTVPSQLRGLHRDQDASAALREARAGIEALQARLRAPGAPVARVLLDLDVAFLAARAAAARARTVESPVGGRAAAPDGVERAKRYAASALQLAPDSATARLLMGDLLVDAQEPEGAEEEYRRALLIEPTSSSGHVKLAEALRLQGRFDAAARALRTAIRLDRRSVAAYSDLGLVLRAQRRVTEALVAYGEALRLDPDASDAHNGLAITLAGIGLLPEAIAEFRQIVRIDPDSAIGYYNLATALADADLDAEAAAALREVIRINPNHYNAHYNLGEMFRLDGKFDDSAAQFREYLRLAPDLPQNRRNIERAKRLVAEFENP